MTPASFDRTRLQIRNPYPGWRGRLVAPLLRLAERVVGLRQIGDLAEQVARLPNARGPGEAWGRVLRIRAETERGSLEGIPTSGPLILVGNHPVGAPEAVAMAALLEHLRPRDGRLLVGSEWSRAPRIAEVSFAVDKKRSSIADHVNLRAITTALDHLRNGGALGVFPAGKISHLTWSHRTISDPAWSRSVGTLAIHSEATIVPIFFHGSARWRFQLAGLAHPLLPRLLVLREVLAAQGTTARFAVGEPIPWQTLKSHGTPQKLTEHVRAQCYRLRNREIDPTRVVDLVESVTPVAAGPND